MQTPLIVFLHIPKTAGSSLVASVRESLSAEQCLLLYGAHRTSKMIRDELSQLSQVQKDTLRFVGGHQVWFGIKDCFPNRDVKFVTFLREPVERVYSNYQRIFIDSAHHLYEQFNQSKPSFADFASGSISPVVINQMTVFLGRKEVTEAHNQHQCVLEDEALLTSAVRNLKRCWFIGLQDCYGQDLQYLSEALNWELREKKVNQRPSDLPRLESESDAAIELCEKHNAMDRQLFEMARRIHRTQHIPSIEWDS